MRKEFGKRGVSDVVSTVLIILLVVAAVAIVGAIVLRTVNKAGPQVQNTVSCEQLQVSATKCTYSGTGNAPTVLVNRRDGDTNSVLKNLTLVFYKGSSSETGYESIFPNVLETKSYDFTLANSAVFAPESVAVSASIMGANGVSVPCALSPKVSCTRTDTVTPPAQYAVTVNRATSGGAGLGVITSTPAGISCGATCTYSSFTGSTTLQVASLPNDGGCTVFVGWSGAGVNCPGTGTCTVSSAATVTATFGPSGTCST